MYLKKIVLIKEINLINEKISRTIFQQFREKICDPTDKF